MEEKTNEKCCVCSAMAKCCCTKHKILHILVWVLVGLAIFTFGVAVGSKPGYYKNSRGDFGQFENKMDCMNQDCPMMQKGIKGNFEHNCMGAVKPVDTMITTGTVE